VLVLLRQNDFSLRGGVLLGRLHEDDVDVLVPTRNADHLVLLDGWLMGGGGGGQRRGDKNRR
jgi:hypothetical protein